MGFLSPWFLGGLLAAAVPLYVHLLRQHRSEPFRFSSTMFLERRTQSSIRHRRLKYFALLSLRLLVIVLLALLFANPFIRRSEAAAAGGRKLMVIAVDNSFSMRTNDRLERARAEALRVVDGMRPGDNGQAMTFASTVQMLTQITGDKAELRRAIQGIQPGDGRSAYGEIARTLRALGRPSGVPVEAHVITDVQRTSMPVPFAELAVPQAMRLQVHAVASGREPNWYVENVNAPRTIYQPKSVRVRATVASAGGPASEVGVELVLNGRTLESRRVNVPAGGRSSIEFQMPEAAYGLNRGEVRLTKGDGLKQDDRFPFALERKEAQRVLLVGNARSATYVQAAMESVPDAGYTIDTQRGVGYERYGAVIVADTAIEGLEDYVRRGGGVFIAVGPVLAAQRRVPVTGDRVTESRYATREGERFIAPGEVDATHPVTARVNGFEGVKFYLTARIDAGKGRVLAKFADGSPLLVEHRIGAGRVLVFASTLDNLANDFPLHSSFLPFLEQSVNFLSGFESAPANYTVDSFVDLRATRDAGTAVDVVDPSGGRALSLKEAAKADAFRLTTEGFYEVRRGNNRNELIAVHADRRESDLDTVPRETLALWEGTGASQPGSGPSAGDQGQKPYSLWWYFALALLIASLVESFFSGRYLAVEEEPRAKARKQAA